MVDVYKEYQRRQVEKHNNLQIQGKSSELGAEVLGGGIERAAHSRMTNPMEITNQEDSQPAH